MLLARPQELQRLVDHHLRGPCLQRTLLAILEIANVGEDVQKSILEHILQVVVIGDVAGTDACQTAGITGIELLGRSLVTLLQPLYQALLIVSGQDAFARLKYESGVHCVKRVPITESSGRIHTSTVTVAVFPEAEEIELQINPNDVRIDVFHASGHGGQGVTTSDSAVRLTHIPTGIVVSCQDERSQLANKTKAFKVLRSRLLDRLQEEQDANISRDRCQQIRSGERSDRIRTYYFNHDYVVDHRLGLTVNRTANVMNGELSPFIEALRLAEKTERLKNIR